MSKETVVILLSGGLDSTIMAYDLSQTYNIMPILFNYGQRHAKELSYALVTCKKLGLTPKIVDLIALNQIAESSLTRLNISVPHNKQPDDESQAITVVPNRNLIMLSLAASYASSIGACKVFYGCHKGDWPIYKDCTPEFVSSLNNILSIQDINATIECPYINMYKHDIISVGKSLNVPFEDTWTCYMGQDNPCGTCGACIERTDAINASKL